MSTIPSALARIEDVYPATPLQQGMLFHALRAPDAGLYFEQSVYAFDGELGTSRFHEAWQRVVDRHAVLRTAFLWEEGRVWQTVLRQARVELDRHDWRGRAPAAQEAALEELLAEDRRRGFDLARPPLLRLTLIDIGEARAWFILSHHHVLVDGWACTLMLKEVAACYRALSLGHAWTPRPAPLYRDYITFLQRQELAVATAFWRAALAGFEMPTPLPAIGAAAQREQHEVVRTPSRELMRQLGRIAARSRITLNTILQGVWAVLLGDYSGLRDVLFGATVSGRPAALAGVEDMVGLFINALPVRVRLDPRDTLADWLRRLHDEQLAAREFEYTPLVEIQAVAETPRQKPLFDSLFVFENYPTEIVDDGGAGARLRIQHVRAVEKVHYPLTVVVAASTTCTIRLMADAACFDRDTIEAMAARFEALLEQVAANPSARVGDLVAMTEDDRRAIAAWNATSIAFDNPGPTVVALFEAQAAQTPEAIAVMASGEALSYGDLERRANRLARYLRARGARPDAKVAICIDRHFGLPMAVLAVLKTGAAYVPLDVSYPRDRLGYMLRDSGACLMLTGSALVDRVTPSPDGARVEASDADATTPHAEIPVILLDREWLAIEAESDAPLPACADAANLGYAIYTSGSTGVPKGIGLPHAALWNLICWQLRSIPRNARVLQFSPLGFDASFHELFSTWGSGGTLVMIADDERRDPVALARLGAREQVTRLFIPFVGLQQLAESSERGDAPRWPSLTEILTAGEQLKVTPAISAFCATRVLRNQYGPSEAHVVSEYRLEDPSRGWPALPPIGAPIANTHLHVVDIDGREVPPGVWGELLIGGVCLARNYLNKPALTAARFIPDALSGEAGARLYRSGDRVRWRADGELEFQGRLDHQIKLRGYRIETAEIEAVLVQLPGIRQSTVLLREDEIGQPRLVAYVVTSEGAGRAAEWREALRDRLPEYMIPAAFVLMERLPMTPNGKVHRAALPKPAPYAAPASTDARPREGLEALVAGIWALVLKRDVVDRHSSFFDLGGHSLLATQVVSRVRQALGVDVPLRALFDAPTLAGFVDWLRSAHGASGRTLPPLVPAPRPPEGLPLSFAQQRLWFLAQLDPEGGADNISYVLRLRGSLDDAALMWSLRAVVARHDVLRTRLVAHEGVPAQRLDPQATLHVPLIELRDLPADRREAEALRITAVDGARPFDLTEAPLLRVRLLRLDDADAVLAVTLSHMVTDGWSAGQLVREFAALYRGYAARAPIALPAPATQYADFAVWQRAWLTDDVVGDELAYWRRELDGVTPIVPPGGRTRRPDAPRRGRVLPFTFDDALSRAVTMMSGRESVTPFMTILAAYAVLLGRATGQADLAVGTDVANRHHLATEGMIGFFVNQLVLRMRLDGAITFRDLLTRARTVMLGACAHQDLPFDRLVEALAPASRTPQTPLFQVKLIFHNNADPALDLPGLDVARIPLVVDVPQFDLTLTVGERDGRLAGYFHHDTNVWGADDVDSMLAQLPKLLETAAREPDVPLATVHATLDADVAARRRALTASLHQTFTDSLTQRRRAFPARA